MKSCSQKEEKNPTSVSSSLLFLELYSLSLSFSPILIKREFEGAGTSPSETKSLPFFISHSRRYLIYYETRGHFSPFEKECLSSRVRKGQFEGRKEGRKEKRPHPLPPPQICLERVFEPRGRKPCLFFSPSPILLSLPPLVALMRKTG